MCPRLVHVPKFALFTLHGHHCCNMPHSRRVRSTYTCSHIVNLHQHFPCSPVLICWNLMKSTQKCSFFQDTNVHRFVLKNFSTFDVLDMSAPAVIHLIFYSCSYVILAHMFFFRCTAFHHPPAYTCTYIYSVSISPCECAEIWCTRPGCSCCDLSRLSFFRIMAWHHPHAYVCI